MSKKQITCKKQITTRTEAAENVSENLSVALCLAGMYERHTRNGSDNRIAVGHARLLAQGLDAITQALSESLPEGFVLGRNCTGKGLEVIDLNEKPAPKKGRTSGSQPSR